MRREDDFAETSEKESNLEDTLDSRLVSHPKSTLSLDRIPSDSLRIVARPLDSVVPDYAVTQPAAADLVRKGPRGKSIATVQYADLHAASSDHADVKAGGKEQTVNGHSPCKHGVGWKDGTTAYCLTGQGKTAC
jgi:hypothetical protein